MNTIYEPEIINNDLFEFINKYAECDPVKLKFKFASNSFTFPLDFALMQISLRQRCKQKLPSFISKSNYLFPDKLASEQASDEMVAEYHASFVKKGNKIIDMSAGLGIDALSFASAGAHVTAVELNDNRSKFLIHNSAVLNLKERFKVVCRDSIQFAKNIDEKFDLLFIDPSRRDNNNRRTYSFKDCEPDIIENLELLLKLADKLLIKASPLLDISHLIKEIKGVNKIHIVVKSGECKEVLLEIKRNFDFEGVVIKELDRNNTETLVFSEEDLRNTQAPIIEDEDLMTFRYLYEPNAGLMKLKCFGAICSKFPELKKISPNTNLFVSNEYYKEFPGRVFHEFKFISKSEYKNLKNNRLNVAVRNYPLSAEELKKKLKVKEGQNRFILGFRVGKKETPVLIECTKLSSIIED